MNRTQHHTQHTGNPIIWKGLSVQLWKPWKNSRNRKIAATPNEGAKPGRLPQWVHRTLRQIRRLGRKCQGVVGTDANQPRFQIASMKPINANAPCKATNVHNPPLTGTRVKFHCASGPHKNSNECPMLSRVLTATVRKFALGRKMQCRVYHELQMSCLSAISQRHVGAGE